MTTALLILGALGVAALLSLAWLWRKVADAPPGNLGDDADELPRYVEFTPSAISADDARYLGTDKGKAAIDRIAAAGERLRR